MAFSQKKYAIDKERLKRAIERAGLRATQISENAGYCAGWITKQISVGELTKPAKAALDAVGIRYEEYAPLSEEGGGTCTAGDATGKSAGMTADELYDIIFRAVRDALKA